MYRIALVCQHGASTGICMRKMIEAAEKMDIACEIDAYSDAELGEIIDQMHCILLAPQLSFKLDRIQQENPENAGKLAVISAMDFGMMDGEKILKEAIARIESL